MAKGLPMDAKSRKARAIEQGYRGYGGARLQNDFDFTTSVIGDNYRERGSFYGKKAPQYGFNQARKLSQYLADNEIHTKACCKKWQCIYRRRRRALPHQRWKENC